MDVRCFCVYENETHCNPLNNPVFSFSFLFSILCFFFLFYFILFHFLLFIFHKLKMCSTVVSSFDDVDVYVFILLLLFLFLPLRVLQLLMYLNTRKIKIILNVRHPVANSHKTHNFICIYLFNCGRWRRRNNLHFINDKMKGLIRLICMHVIHCSWLLCSHDCSFILSDNHLSECVSIVK